MSKASSWVGVISTPLLLVSLGCSISHRPLSTTNRELPPERLMAMARAFELQGNLLQAKKSYLQVLAVQPEYPNAQRCLDTLIANEDRKNRGQPLLPSGQFVQIASRLDLPSSVEINRRLPVEQPLKDKPRNSEHAIAEVRTLQTELVKSGRADSNLSDSPQQVAPTVIGSLTPENYFEEGEDDAKSSHRIEKESALPTALALQELDDVKPYESSAIDPLMPEKLALQNADDYEPSLTVAAGSSLPELKDTPATLTTSSPSTSAIENATAAVSRPPVDEETPVSAFQVDADLPVTFEYPIYATSVPELNTKAIASTNSKPMASATISADETQSIERPTDPIEFFEPFVSGRSIATGQIGEFFGAFHVGMISEAKSRREVIQPQLLAVACDQYAGSELRARAAFLLGTMGADAIDAVPRLRRVMHHESDDFLKIDFSEAILKMQPDDVDAINVLVACLSDTDQNVRWIAAFALRNAVSPKATFVIDSLREVLKTDDLKLRRMVFLTLAEFGPAAAKVVPELEAALECEDRATREVAKASLACIAPDRKTSANTETKRLRSELANFEMSAKNHE